MRPRAIEHITITSGGVRTSPRSEVASEVLGDIRQALANGGRLWTTGWRVEMLGSPPGGHVFDLDHDRVGHVVRCWLCLDRKVSDAMWEAAASGDLLDERVVLSRPKGQPWLAAAIIPGTIQAALEEPALLSEAGDLERCVAWALIEAK